MNSPVVFQYHDYRAFIRDWLAHLRVGRSRVSMRTLAREVGLSVTALSLILKGTRKLSPEFLPKMVKVLKLNPAEARFLEDMVELGDSDSPEIRHRAFDRMSRSKTYRKQNPNEAHAYQYLTHWYFVAIRELANHPDFRPDPIWIRAQLKNKVPLQEIQKALNFLLENGYLERQADGSIRPPSKPIECLSGVYRLALAQFHREMLALATEAIDTTSSENRILMGYTMAVDAKGYDQVRAIIEAAYEQIKKLALNSTKAEAVYHVELAGFPLTKGEKK